MQGWTPRAVAIALYFVAGLLLPPVSVWAEEKAEEQAQDKIVSTDFKIFPSLRTSFLQKARYEKALTVLVKNASGKLFKDKTFTVMATIRPETVTKVKLFTGRSSTEAASKELRTDEKGQAVFGILTEGLDDDQDKLDFEILVRVTPAPPDPKPGLQAPEAASGEQPEANAAEADAREMIVQGIVFAENEQALGSDPVSFEMFMGTALARTYDAHGKSTGFDDTSLVGRLRFDTLYGRNKPRAFHTGFELQFSSFPTAAPATNGNGNGNGAGEGNGNGNGNGDGEVNPFTDFADSYTGSLVFIYQPGWRWTHRYTDTAHNRDPKLHYDAMRWGLTGRLSVISRDIQEDNLDTEIFSARLGVLFTHHQTAASEAAYDDVNVFPTRFVEVSYGYYETIYGKEDENRLIVEAGLRVPGLGTNTIPFYGGVFLNAGQGQDDFRVFAGFLFPLDRIREAF